MNNIKGYMVWMVIGGNFIGGVRCGCIESMRLFANEYDASEYKERLEFEYGYVDMDLVDIN